jgi:hypothetical protein
MIHKIQLDTKTHFNASKKEYNKKIGKSNPAGLHLNVTVVPRPIGLRYELRPTGRTSSYFANASKD